MKNTILIILLMTSGIIFGDEAAVTETAASVGTPNLEEPRSAGRSLKLGSSGTPMAIEKTVVADMAFTGEALVIKKRMDVLFEASKKINANGVDRSKARGAIEGSMDWDRVAEHCLGQKKWKTESGSNKTQFRNLLRDVIVKTAYTRLDKFWDGNTTYEFSKIDVKRQEALVVSKFMVNGDSFTLEYYMNKSGSTWYIWDISYESERYSVNINEQIDAFLREKGFATLIEKLKKRRSDLEESAAKKS